MILFVMFACYFVSICIFTLVSYVFTMLKELQISNVYTRYNETFIFINNFAVMRCPRPDVIVILACTCMLSTQVQATE